MTEASVGDLHTRAETGRPRIGRPGDAEAPEGGLLEIGDLVSRLRFMPQEGRIWLDAHRVMLINLSTLGALRRELIDTVGVAKARGLLTRLGYSAGTRDAELAKTLRPRTSISEAFLVGPQLRALKGGGFTMPVRIEADAGSGRFYGEFITLESFEVDSHVSCYGVASDPVCWMHVGYASGFASTFLGRAILYREVECRAMGADHCRMIGKPAEEWEGADDDFGALRAEEFVNGFPATGAGGTPLGRYHEAMVGASSEFIAACRLLQKVARTPATVLLQGETGVGKEIFARTLHRVSARADRPFITVNCAAIPDNLIEAELFGVEKGAYTGAMQTRPGRFERADKGTLFLDEVGTLTPTAQLKLLRAIQEGEIEHVGGTRTMKVEVRLVAATNVNLEDAVAAGKFREDLFFRLNVFPILIPPLRNRRDDIPLLMDYFLHRFIAVYGKRVTGFTSRAVDALYEYDYPGNIRELEHLIERAVIMVEEGHPIDLADLFTSQKLAASAMLRVDRSGSLHASGDGAAEREAVADIVERIQAGTMSIRSLESRLMREAVRRAGGNVSEAARLLHIKRSQLDYRLRKERPS